MKNLVSVSGLNVSFYSYRGTVRALQNVSLDIRYNETLGLVGETGCGKSTLGLSIVRLIPKPGKIESGEIYLDGTDLVKLSEDEMKQMRRTRISMISQDPTTSLNPIFKVGDQIAEGFIIRQGMEKSKALEETVSMLMKVGISNPEKVGRQYPHELSGGMKQRIMIAIALSAKQPALLIADEPTSSLDVTIQAQILDLVRELKSKFEVSVLLITHDMGVIAQNCDRVAVMYAGNIVEVGSVLDVFRKPKHPYTMGLMETVTLHKEEKQLRVIPGAVPDLIDIPSGCSFHPRCSYCVDHCRIEAPTLVEIEPDHFVACAVVSRIARKESHLVVSG